MAKQTYPALQADDLKNVELLKPEEKLTGYTQSVVETLKEFTQSNNAYFVARPVNETAIHLIKKGAKVKRLDVHGKSADRGMPNGLIPVEAALSKAGKTNNAENIAKFNGENALSLQHSAEQFNKLQAQLTQTYNDMGVATVNPDDLLKKAGVNKDMFNSILATVDLVDKRGNPIFFFTNDQSQALRQEELPDRPIIYAVRSGDNYMPIDENHNPTGQEVNIPRGYLPKQIEVFAQPEIEVSDKGVLGIKGLAPITADIDGLAIGLRKKTNLKMEPIVGHDEIVAAQQENIKQEDFASAAEFNQRKEDIKVGLAHLSGMGEAPLTLHAITGFMSANLDHSEITHGTEQYNLKFPQPLDSHWIGINPKGEIEKIEGEDNLIKYFNKAKKKGYTMEPNPHWAWVKDHRGLYSKDEELNRSFQKVDAIVSQANPKDEEIVALKKLKVNVGSQAIGRLDSKNSLTQNKKLLKEEITTIYREKPALANPTSQTVSLEAEGQVSHSLADRVAKNFRQIFSSTKTTPPPLVEGQVRQPVDGRFKPKKYNKI